jgi:general secretion pathway protein K
MKKIQQGFALVVAMLIVAIATIVATQIFYQQQIAIRRTLNQLQAEQLYQLALSTEAWVKVILKEDAIKNNFDYVLDAWAQPMAPFDAEGAVLKTKTIDYQSCFNINNLVLNGKGQPEQIKILQNLMTQLNLNPELVWSLVDWLDADDEPYPAGAEWETYSRLTPAYRTANYRIIELTELYAISRWKSETINPLTPYICALPPAPQLTATGRFFPDTANSLININTADIKLLQALSVEMRTANLTNILEYRKNKGYNSIATFLTQLDVDNPKNPKLSTTFKKEFLSVDSHYFMLEYNGLMEQLEQNYHSLIYRDSNKQLHTLYRLQYY